MRMVRSIFRGFSFGCIFAVLMAVPVWGQQTAADESKVSYPSGNPGVYAQDAAGWHLLTVAAPTKVKAKHAFLSGLSYGAVAAPVVAVYSGNHAQVQVHAVRPLLCVYHVMTPSAPLLVRLKEKKNTREIDSGNVRAVPLKSSSHQAKADADIMVPIRTIHSEGGVILFQPKEDLAPGEYAVMFGPGNLAIMDFDVAAAQ